MDTAGGLSPATPGHRCAAPPAVLLVHAALIASAPRFPDALAAAVAGTVYAPLWPQSALGLPVQAPAAASGWSSPTLLGWGCVAAIWTAGWALAIAGLTRRGDPDGSRPTAAGSTRTRGGARMARSRARLSAARTPTQV